MKKALLYAAFASLLTLGFAMLFVAITSLIPALPARINYDALASAVGFIMVFGIIPLAGILGYEQHLCEVEQRRLRPVHERENLRPLHLEQLPDTLRAIAASRR